VTAAIPPDHRHHGLDALRGAMMLLGLVLHSAMFYAVDPHLLLVPLTDRNRTPLADLLFDAIHAFRMPAFFVLAGFFAAMLVARRGLWGTLKNRAARVLAPFVAALFLVFPVAVYLMLSMAMSVRYGTHDLAIDVARLNQLGRELIAKGIPADEPSPVHLWFLYYLLYFYLALPICEAIASRLVSWRDAACAGVRSAGLLAGLAFITALTLLPFKGGQVMNDFGAFRPQWHALAYYGFFFLCGYLKHANQLVLPALRAQWRGFLLVGLMLFPLTLWLSGMDNARANTVLEIHAAAALINALCTWALVFAAIGAALAHIDRPSPWVLYTSRSAYWVYLVHVIFTTEAAWWLSRYDLPGTVKMSSVFAFATVLSFLSYHYLVQSTWVSVFLNGRRYDMPWP
jgi:peptidoglycan/LPS O-acetylase OafA/YrhL